MRSSPIRRSVAATAHPNSPSHARCHRHEGPSSSASSRPPPPPPPVTPYLHEKTWARRVSALGTWLRHSPSAHARLWPPLHRLRAHAPAREAWATGHFVLPTDARSAVRPRLSTCAVPFKGATASTTVVALAPLARLALARDVVLEGARRALRRRDASRRLGEDLVRALAHRLRRSHPRQTGPAWNMGVRGFGGSAIRLKAEAGLGHVCIFGACVSADSAVQQHAGSGATCRWRARCEPTALRARLTRCDADCCAARSAR